MQISEAELREDINVLNVVNFGGGSYVLYAEIDDARRDRGRPRALLGQLRAPGAAAAGRGQGARRGDRPHRRAPARGLAGSPRARRSSPRSAPTRWSRGCTSPTPAATTRASRASRRRRSSDRRLLRLDYYKPNEDEFSDARRRALRARQRPRGLVRRVLRPRARRRAPLPPGPHPPRRGHRHAVRAAPGGRPGRRGRRLAAHRRGRRRRGSRASGSRPSARAGRARSAASRRSSPTARSIVELPLQGHGLPRARRARRGRRRRRARAGRGARGGARRRRSACAPPRCAEPHALAGPTDLDRRDVEQESSTCVQEACIG